MATVVVPEEGQAGPAVRQPAIVFIGFMGAGKTAAAKPRAPRA